jgi:hypothetical protein
MRRWFLNRGRDGKFPGLVDTVVQDAGIERLLSGSSMSCRN